MRALPLAAAALALAGCGGPAWEFSVRDHANGLTGSPDMLFIMKVVHAPQVVPITQVKLSAGLPGDTPVDVDYDFDDADGDGKLSDGDNLVGKEGIADRFDQAVVGKDVEVGVRREIRAGSDNRTQLGKALWSAN
ncbi:MAG: hypothetical protein ACYC8T_04540 [Myxococcaceae bacterium]